MMFDPCLLNNRSRCNRVSREAGARPRTSARSRIKFKGLKEQVENWDIWETKI